jgi:hypothetical protein
MPKKEQALSLSKIAFLQAAGLVGYCGLVALIFVRGDKWFGPMSWWGPVLFLVLFVFSALASALLTLGYSVYLIWDRKQVKEGLKLVVYTSGWLALFIVTVIFVVVW